MCERIFWQSTLKVLRSSQVEFLRAEGYDQLAEGEKEVLACDNCIDDVSRKAVALLHHHQWFFLPAPAEFTQVERDRGTSRGRSTAISAGLRNNLVNCNEKIYRTVINVPLEP